MLPKWAKAIQIVLNILFVVGALYLIIRFDLAPLFIFIGLIITLINLYNLHAKMALLQAKIEDMEIKAMQRHGD